MARRDIFEQVKDVVKSQTSVPDALVTNLHGAIAESSIRETESSPQEWYAVTVDIPTRENPSLHTVARLHTFQRHPLGQVRAVNGVATFSGLSREETQAVAFFGLLKSPSTQSVRLTISGANYNISVYVSNKLVATTSTPGSVKVPIPAGSSSLSVIASGGEGPIGLAVSPSIEIALGEPIPPTPIWQTDPVVRYLNPANGSYRVDLSWQNDAFASEGALYRSGFQDIATSSDASIVDGILTVRVSPGEATAFEGSIAIGNMLVGEVIDAAPVDPDDMDGDWNISILLNEEASQTPEIYNNRLVSVPTRRYEPIARIPNGGDPLVSYSDLTAEEGQLYEYRVTAFGFITGQAESDFSVPAYVHVKDVEAPSSVDMDPTRDIAIVNGEAYVSFTSPSDPDFKGLLVYLEDEEDPDNLQLVATWAGVPSTRYSNSFRPPGAGRYWFKSFDWANNIQSSAQGVSWDFTGDGQWDAPISAVLSATPDFIEESVSLTLSVSGKLSRFPVKASFFEEIGGDSIELDNTGTTEAELTAPGIISGSEYDGISALPLPHTGTKQWFARIVDNSGNETWVFSLADRGKAPDGTVVVDDFQPTPSFTIIFDDDVEKIEIQKNETSVVILLRGNGLPESGGGSVQYTLPSPLEVDSADGVYTVDFIGNSLVSRKWEGSVHGPASSQPIIDSRIQLDPQYKNAADIYLTPRTAVAEMLTVQLRDEANPSNPLWDLVTGDGSSTKRYVSRGTEVGPNAWFKSGSTWAQKLNNYPLTSSGTITLSAKAVGQVSQKETAWQVVSLPLSEIPVVTAVDLVYDASDSKLYLSATAGIHSQSIRYEFSDDAEFSSIKHAVEGVLLAGQRATKSLVLSEEDLGKTWYGRVVVYNGAYFDGSVSGLGGFPATDTVFAESGREALPSGSVHLVADAGGNVTLTVTPNELAKSFGYKISPSAFDLDPTGQTTVNISAATHTITPPSIPGTAGDRYITVWFYSDVDGGGLSSEPVTDLIKWEKASKPRFEFIRQTLNASGNVDITLRIEDPRQLGGTLSVWTNKTTATSPDPSTTAQASKAITTTPFTESSWTEIRNIVTNAAEDKYIYLNFTNSAGDSTGKVGVKLTSKLHDIAPDGSIADGVINADHFDTDTKPVVKVSSLPSTGQEGDIVYLTTDQKLYRRTSTGWTAAVASADIAGQINAAQIADGSISQSKIETNSSLIRRVTTLPTSGTSGEVVFLTTNNKLYRYTGSTWTAEVPATDLVGQITTPQLADGSISHSKFATNTQPIRTVSSLPSSGAVGEFIYLTTDQKLYRRTSSGWTSSITATDISGEIQAGQIANGAITLQKFQTGLRPIEAVATLPGSGTIGQVVFLTTNSTLYRWNGSAFIANVSAAHLTGEITSTQIADNAISTPKIAANAVTAQAIAANAVQSNHISANTIDSGHVRTNAIGTNHLSARSITSSKLLVGNFTNLVPNPDFSTGDFRDWQPWSGASRVSVIPSSEAGVPSDAPTPFVCKFESTGANTVTMFSNGGHVENSLGGIKCTPGERYQVKIDHACSPGTTYTTTRVYAYFLHADGTHGGSSVDLDISPSWDTTTWEFVVPENRVKMAIYIYTSGLDGSFYFTNVSLTRMVGTLIEDGAITTDKITSNAIVAGHIQSGIIDTSHLRARSITSDKLLIGNFSNLIPNPVFATGDFTDWSLWVSPDRAHVLDRGTGGTPGGAPTAKVARFSAHNGETVSAFTHSDRYDSPHGGITVTPGEKYVVEIDCALLAGSVFSATQMNMYFYRSDGTTTQINRSLTPTTSWTTQTQLFTVPANAIKAQIYILTIGTAGAFYFTNLRATKQVGATTIEDGAIVTSKIATNAITSNKILAGEINSSHIASAAITSDKIAAGSISARELAIVVSPGAALNNDPHCQDITAWTISGNITSVAAAGPAGTHALQATSTTSPVVNSVAVTNRIPIDPNKVYRITGHMRRVSGDSRSYLGFRGFTADGTTTGTYYGLNNQLLPTTWGEFSYTIGPSGSGADRIFWANTSLIVGMVLIAYNGTGVGQAQEIRIEEVIPGTLIRDGAIVTSKLAAGAVDANAIAANSIQSDHIVANSITSGKLAVASVGATHIASNSIDASHIRANAIETNHLAARSITSDKLLIGNFTNLIPNPEFDTGDITDWRVGNSANSISVVHRDADPDMPAGGPSRYMLRFHTSTPTLVALFSHSDAYNQPRGGIAANAGERYRVELSYCMSPGTTAVTQRVYAYFYKHDGTVPSHVVGLAATTDWKVFATEFVIPEGTKKFTMFLRIDGLNGKYYFAKTSVVRMTGTTLIEDGAITTDKLRANSIIAGHIQTGAIDSGHIQANAIETKHLSSRSVTSEKLLIGNFTNLIPNPTFASGDFSDWRIWSGGALATVVDRTAAGVPPNAPTEKVARLQERGGGTVAVFTHTDAYNTPYGGVTVRPGEKYYVSIDCAVASGSVFSATRLYIHYYRANGTTASQHISLTPTTNWGTFETVWTVLEDAIKAHLYVYTIGTSGAFYFTNVTLTKQAGNTTIEDGAITTDKIFSNAITSDKVSAGAIDSNAIAANAITSQKILSGAITSDKISAGAIVSGKIQAGSISSTELASNSVTSAKVSAGAITADKLSVSNLSAISNDLGIVVSGKLQGNGGAFLDLNATSSQEILYHPRLSLSANGSAIFRGNVVFGWTGGPVGWANRPEISFHRSDTDTTGMVISPKSTIGDNSGLGFWVGDSNSGTPMFALEMEIPPANLPRRVVAHEQFEPRGGIAGTPTFLDRPTFSSGFNTDGSIRLRYFGQGNNAIVFLDRNTNILDWTIKTAQAGSDGTSELHIESSLGAYVRIRRGGTISATNFVTHSPVPPKELKEMSAKDWIDWASEDSNKPPLARYPNPADLEIKALADSKNCSPEKIVEDILKPHEKDIGKIAIGAANWGHAVQAALEVATSWEEFRDLLLPKEDDRLPTADSIPTENIIGKQKAP